VPVSIYRGDLVDGILAINHIAVCGRSTRTIAGVCGSGLLGGLTHQLSELFTGALHQRFVFVADGRTQFGNDGANLFSQGGIDFASQIIE